LKSLTEAFLHGEGNGRHPKRGTGYRYVSREILLYEDPVTEKPLTTWKNSWTGEESAGLDCACENLRYN
jgi:hypothetical protein